MCCGAAFAGSRGEALSLLFFCRRFLFQIKRKCRNAENIKCLLMVGRKGRVRIPVPLARQRCVGVAAPYKLCANKSLQTSRADDIRLYCIHFIYCFERSETNLSVALRQLPYRGAKIDSATNLNLSIRFTYARRYINWTFSAAISSSEKFFLPCSKISNSRVLYFARFV